MAGHGGPKLAPRCAVVCMCTRTAVLYHPIHPAVLLLIEATGAGQFVPFNDGQQSVEPILAAFDRAIQWSVARGLLPVAAEESL